MNADAQGADSSGGVFQERELASLFANLTHYPRVALAVSGGADSVALMFLVRSWLDLRSSGPQITVLTVDHRLREAAASEAEWVKGKAKWLDFQHETLVWEGEKPRSGLQAEARSARYGLMTDYCRAVTIPAIATAHTSDDQAETFLMRLARGSGLDGLSAMEDISRRDGIDILRPLLMISRPRIEAFLTKWDQSWLDDPSNEDERYERVRVRRKLKAAQSLGLSPAAIALSARRLRRARDALEGVTSEFLRAKVSLHEAGFAKLRLPELIEIHEDVAIRALARMIAAVGGSSDPLRLWQIEGCYRTMRRAPRSATLGGCRLIAKNAELTIIREVGRMDTASGCDIQPGETKIWDGRFRVTHMGGEAGATLRALGADGISIVKAAKGQFGEVPRLAAMTLPSLWIEGKLCYAPFIDFAGHAPDGWSPLSHAEFTNTWHMPATHEELESPTQPHA